MSEKQFVSAGDAETLLTEVQERLALRPKTFTGTTAAWEELSVADREKYEIVNITDDTTSGGDSGQKIQVVELPTADATSLGKIYQYIGTTTDTLVNGFFYQCVFDNGVYQWIGKAVQAGGGGGQDYIAGFGIDINSSNIIKTTDFVGTEAEWDALPASEKAKYDFIYTDDEEDVDVATPGHAIVDNEGVEKVQRTNLQFEDLMVGDDSMNDATIVSAANKQNVVLSSSLPIGGVNRTTIEDALSGLNTEVEKRPIVFTGTRAEWNAVENQSVYELVNITDDSETGETVDAVTDGDMRAVTSNAVHDALGFGRRITASSVAIQGDGVTFTPVCDYSEFTGNYIGILFGFSIARTPIDFPKMMFNTSTNRSTRIPIDINDQCIGRLGLRLNDSGELEATFWNKGTATEGFVVWAYTHN